MRLAVTVTFLALFLPTTYAFPSLDLKSLWDVKTDDVSYKVSQTYFVNNIVVNEVFYQSREFNGKPARIFGYYCYPAGTAKPLPGLLISHGGGGTANLSRTAGWARRGYAVLSIDLPGKGLQRSASRSTGPNMDVPTLLTTIPDPGQNYLVHAVAAIRNGITFLTEQPQVDPERIGMVGLSWGGVLTLLTNGQDDRLKAAVNVFGAGYIPEGCTWQDRFDTMSDEQLQTWNNKLDPRNFLADQHAPIFFVTGTNDHCYYLPTFQKSYDLVTVPKQLYLVPNLKHDFFQDTQQVVMQWLDDQLKYNGRFPEVTFMSVYCKGRDKLIVAVKAKALHNVAKVTLHYCEGGPSRWTAKVWQAKEAYFEDDTYYFGLPVSQIKPEIQFFVNVADDRGRVSSTPVRSLLKVNNLAKRQDAFAISAPIKKINVHEPPLQLLGETSPIPPDLMRLVFFKPQGTYQLVEANSKN